MTLYRNAVMDVGPHTLIKVHGTSRKIFGALIVNVKIAATSNVRISNNRLLLTFSDVHIRCLLARFLTMTSVNRMNNTPKPPPTLVPLRSHSANPAPPASSAILQH